MRIVVIGAGGTGGLYGGLLARAGHQVGFLARGAHLNVIRAQGLEIRSAEFGTFRVHAPASDTPTDLGQAELVLFAVKTYDLDEAAESARQVFAPDGALLTLQNGLDAPERVGAVVGEQRVLIGTTGLETTVLEPGVIGHLSPFHFLTVSAFKGPATAQVENTVEVLRQAGINARSTPDGHRALWEKAIMLIPLATVSSVSMAGFGSIRDLPESRALAETLFDEALSVARVYGYDMPDAHERARKTFETSAPTMMASMARDFERGNRTELESLTGALLRMADAKGVDLPATRTAYAILKLRQQLNLKAAAGSRGTVGASTAGE